MLRVHTFVTAQLAADFVEIMGGEFGHEGPDCRSEKLDCRIDRIGLILLLQSAFCLLQLTVARDPKSIVGVLKCGRDAGAGGAAGGFDVVAPGASAGGASLAG